jgi:hypothetical protein
VRESKSLRFPEEQFAHGAEPPGDRICSSYLILEFGAKFQN